MSYKNCELARQRYVFFLKCNDVVAGMQVEAEHDNQIPNQVGDDGKWLILWGYVMDNLENLHNFAAWEFKLR